MVFSSLWSRWDQILTYLLKTTNIKESLIRHDIAHLLRLPLEALFDELTLSEVRRAMTRIKVLAYDCAPNVEPTDAHTIIKLYF